MTHQARNAATRPRIEELEPRTLPSATYTGGLTPGQVRHAYGFDRISFGSARGDGRGQTIAIVTAYDDPTIATDLALFDRQFALPAPAAFTKLALPGTRAVNPTWSLETALDVEWAHAVAPGAKLLLVEAPTGNLGDLLGAADTARQQAGVSVVAMSWGTAELSVETALDSTFTTAANHPGVAFVAGSGDGGAAGALWPALSPNVLAVGGTVLTVSATGTYVTESAWVGSGGGASMYETAPVAQTAVTKRARRTGPDVAYGATSYAVYTSVTINGLTGWMTTGGTSAGAPQWAGLIAVADQGRTLAGQANLTDAVSAIYSLPATDFHDITTGGNGVISARPGYDTITGRGSPYADRVVNGLVAAVTGPAPAPARAPSNNGLDLSFIASRFANFVQKTTGGAVPTALLPDAGFMSAWAGDVLRTLLDAQRRR
jgi:subtilase family serine protease